MLQEEEAFRALEPLLDQGVVRLETGGVLRSGEIFKPVILANAASVILAHNHPSGDPTPSAEVRTVTRQLVAAGTTLGIEVLDHVIVGESLRYHSFRECGLMESLTG